MDTKIIQQYGEDILCYRLRTARQKKRMQHKDLEKKLIGLKKERWALRRQLWNMGWDPLIPPVQKGWKRFFVLRDDVARSQHAEFFQNILKKINTYDWSHRKDFMVRKRRFGKKKYEVKGQKLKEPYACEFAKLDLTDKEKEMFYAEFRFEYWNKGPVKRYVFSEPWRFVLKVKPNMITKIRKLDPQLESRLQQINSYLERNNYEGKLDRLMRGSYKWKELKWKNYGRYDEEDLFQNKSLCQIMDMIKE